MGEWVSQACPWGCRRLPQHSAGVQVSGTQGQRGLSLSVSVVRLPCPHPTPQRPRPLQNLPGNLPKPLPPRCLLCSKGIEDGMKLLAGKLEVLLGNKLWEPQEALGQAGSAGGLSCWPISATCPEGRREPTIPTASARAPRSCEQSPASVFPAASLPYPSIQAYPVE